MKIWDKLSPQQHAVMRSALEEQCLNYVIYLFYTENLRRTNEAWITEDEVRSLIPQFAEVVADLAARGWIEIREPWVPWDEAPILSGQELTQTLADPDTWIWDEQGGRRMVGLMSTAQWDALTAPL